MGFGKIFYSCRCGGEIMNEWDWSTDHSVCNNCDNPRPLPNIYIVGEAGSGKDFLVGVTKEIYPDYHTLKISQPLYDLVGMVKEGDKIGFISLFQKLESI